MPRGKPKTKTTLEVFCTANHEKTLMIRVITNDAKNLRERSVDLWCSVCNRTCNLWIGTAQIITKYEDCGT